MRKPTGLFSMVFGLSWGASGPASSQDIRPPWHTTDTSFLLEKGVMHADFIDLPTSVALGVRGKRSIKQQLANYGVENCRGRASEFSE